MNLPPAPSSADSSEGGPSPLTEAEAQRVWAAPPITDRAVLETVLSGILAINVAKDQHQPSDTQHPEEVPIAHT
ncbi:hypothetical protein [Nocardia sp. NBC_01009]|uniref:hypothetical protein n=1 Tax=Nocardia sp. NBC_01009 TaxID=2975996 RepID=UPI003864E53E|nr:hypothetical protein OHA42_17370 [Nocardia sp. NBC_01009]